MHWTSPGGLVRRGREGEGLTPRGGDLEGHAATHGAGQKTQGRLKDSLADVDESVAEGYVACQLRLKPARNSLDGGPL